jgi:hypothetical protein
MKIKIDLDFSSKCPKLTLAEQDAVSRTKILLTLKELVKYGII